MTGRAAHHEERHTMLKTVRRAGVVTTALLALASLAHTPARAQGYPERPIKFIAATSAGATADLIARNLAEAMSKVLNQNIIVENKPGADQIIGLEFIAKGQPADGYTVGVIGYDGQVQLPLLKRGLRFDPMADLTPVYGLGEVRYAIAGPATAPYRNFRELTAAVKAAPGKFNYGSSTPAVRIPSLIVMQELGLDMVHIPYAGGGPYLTALAAGTIDWATVGENSGNTLKPRVRLYGISGKTRSAGNPDVPTFTELGHPRIVGPAYALMVRTGTSAAIIDRLASTAAAAMATDAFKAGAKKMEFEIVPDSPAGVLREMQERFKFYQEVLAKSGIKPE